MPSKGKVRLTDLLVARGFCDDVVKAERMVLAGQVYSDERVLTQPKMLVDPSLAIRLKPSKCYVSRGGDKLAGALADLSVDVSGKHCLDVGASTGGFTDCLLRHGAASVVALDVAYGQFAWQLRTDERIRLLERTNIREAVPKEIGAPFDLIVVDLSFVSLHSVMAALVPFCSDKTQLVLLVKPQFELSSSLVQNGVITEVSLHVLALDQVIEAAISHKLAPQSVTFSPIRGVKGNIEFFLLATFEGIPATIDTLGVVTRAHEGLDLRK